MRIRAALCSKNTGSHHILTAASLYTRIYNIISQQGVRRRCFPIFLVSHPQSRNKYSCSQRTRVTRVHQGNWTSWQGISHNLHSYISLNAKPTRVPLIELILISKAWACSPSLSSGVCILVSALCSSQFSQVEK